KDYGALAGLKVHSIVGGTSVNKDRNKLHRGTDILVATPGRLLDLIDQKAFTLDKVEVLVLDEADQMLDLGFIHALRRISQLVPEDRQTLFFSATMPKQIQELVGKYCRNPVKVSVTPESTTAERIDQYLFMVQQDEKQTLLEMILSERHQVPGKFERVLIFARTKHGCDRVVKKLAQVGIPANAIHGNKSQPQRERALDEFKRAKTPILIATDVAARGIDLPTLSLVIHVEIPRDAETLQHRSGRTGRAGKKGTAALVVPYNRRRRVEGMLRGAQIEAEWLDAPTPEAIRAKDRTRLIERLTEPREFDEYERELGAQLMAKMSPEDIATALVQTLRAEMPAPEELIANTPEARDRAKAERHRPGFEDVVWFRMSIGRRQNAEPRWLLPLICRRGHITRNEIGAIRIGQHESWFQVPRPIAAKVAETVTRTASPEDEQDEIMIEEAPDGPRIEARENRRKHADGGGRVDPRPAGRGPHRKPGGKPPFKKGKPGTGKPGSGKGAGGKPFAGKPKFKGKPKGKGKPAGPRGD
ncbi:MAG TPA: DEAD/DEAH box helicase, partial [Erythrobacter sp.]|nr:DEAD/DEAH box helicase [Erythrobacter sp.]